MKSIQSQNSEFASDARDCPRCKGVGTQFCEAFSYGDTHYPSRVETCYCCKGDGKFKAPVIAEILGEIRGRKGLRSKRPDGRRAYYVWRMARFHGGVDVTMPMCAVSELGKDRSWSNWTHCRMQSQNTSMGRIWPRRHVGGGYWLVESPRLPAYQ